MDIDVEREVTVGQMVKTTRETGSRIAAMEGERTPGRTGAK
jgi:hypothetical protein